MSDLVRLKYATTQQFSVGGIPGGVAYTYVRVKVKNVDPTKDIQVHYQQLSSPPGWDVFSLPWIANYGDYDVFGHANGFITYEFAVRAGLAGMVDWDNNQGANYHISTFQNVVGGHVMLNLAVAKQGTQVGGGFTFQTSWFEGEIYVNNLAYAKDVGVRYTTNNWLQTLDTKATYAGPVTEGTYAASAGAELWKFKTPELNYDNAAASFAFAVYFNRLDTGAGYWDNNFGQNYKLSKVHLASIE